MTTDHDHTDQDQTVAMLRWRREMSTFKQVNLTAQGVDEESCFDELERKLVRFAMYPDDWTRVSAVFNSHQIQQNQDGAVAIEILEVQASYIACEGLVPWAGVE